MKILEVVPHWPTTTFLTRHIADLSREIPSFQVGVIFPTKNRMANVFDTESNVEIIPLYLGTATKRAAAILTGLIDYPSKDHLSFREKFLLRTIEVSNPDIVHFHFDSLAFSLSHLCVELGIPFTVSLRGPEVQMVAFTDEEYKGMLCNMLQRTTAIHSVCDALGTKASELCNVKLPVFTIRTSIPLPEDPEKTVSKTRSLITVGRLFWKKGFHDLIRAMQYIPDVSLKIVGEGEERVHLTYLIRSLNLQDRVQLLGKLPYEEFETLVRCSTAYVQSSMEEGFSNSLAEAMALGKPVFVTNVGGTGEVIKDGENGIYIPMGDPVGMAQQFEKLSDSQLMQRLGHAARKTAEEEFTAEKHVQGFLNFYNYVFQKSVTT